MDEVFNLLAQGEMPNFLELLEALSEISDFGWLDEQGLCVPQTPMEKSKRVSNHPCFQPGRFCELC